jgi:nitrogen regulatory protein PII
MTVVEVLDDIGISSMTFVGATGTGVWQHVTRGVSPQKTLLLSVIPAEMTEPALAALRDKAGLSEPGRGVAFTVPVSGGVGAGIDPLPG